MESIQNMNVAKQGESWGVFDTLYLLQRDDERTGKKLKKPKLWIVKIDKKGRDKLSLWKPRAVCSEMDACSWNGQKYRERTLIPL